MLWGFVSISLILVLPLVWTTFSYFNFLPDFGFLKIKEKAVQTGWYLPFYYLHVLPAGLVLLAGLVQILPLNSIFYRKVHRWIGRFYVFIVLFLVGPGALGMTFFIERGASVFLSFFLQNLLWMGFTYKAFHTIKDKKVDFHRKWALRSFALAFAAVTLRLYIFIFNWDFNLSSSSGYALIAWASWLLNLVVVEIFLQLTMKKTTALSKI